MRKTVLLLFMILLVFSLLGDSLFLANIPSNAYIDARTGAMGGCNVSIPGEIASFYSNGSMLVALPQLLYLFTGFGINTTSQWYDLLNSAVFSSYGSLTSIGIMENRGGIAYDVLASVDSTTNDFAGNIYIGELLVSFNSMTNGDRSKSDIPFFIGINISYLHSIVAIADLLNQKAVVDYGNGVNVDLGFSLIYDNFSMGFNVRGLYSKIWYSHFDPINIIRRYSGGISLYNKTTILSFQMDYAGGEYIYRTGFEKFLFESPDTIIVSGFTDIIKNIAPIIRFGAFTNKIDSDWREYVYSVGIGFLEGGKRLDLMIMANYNDLINRNLNYMFSVIWKL